MAKKPVTELGKWAPSNLKFGIIVAVAIFWVYFIRSFLYDMFVAINSSAPMWLVDLCIALLATLVGYLVLTGYRKIRSGLRKIEVG